MRVPALLTNLPAVSQAPARRLSVPPPPPIMGVLG